MNKLYTMNKSEAFQQKYGWDIIDFGIEHKDRVGYSVIRIDKDGAFKAEFIAGDFNTEDFIEPKVETNSEETEGLYFHTIVWLYFELIWTEDETKEKIKYLLLGTDFERTDTK